MGVYIRGMKMPTSCLSCPLQGGTADCRLTQKTYNWGLTERPSDCPLVHVLPHGRLIDADKATEKVWELMRFPSNLVNTQWIENTLREMPTVIPADKEET